MFGLYQSGIFTGDDCTPGPGNQDHTVQAVGYGEAGSVKYAILRNQWGTGWGEDGYMRIKLDTSAHGVCGLYQYAWLV